MSALTESAERHRFWLSVAALAVALPAAITVNSWESVSEWRSRTIKHAVPVEHGATQAYAGAQWRLTDVTRLRDTASDALVIVAEFDAAIDNPDQLHNGVCQVVLTDDKGRRWKPAFITSRVVRQGRPAAAEKPPCGALMRAEKGKTVAMAETFIVPQDAAGLLLSVAVSSAEPDVLLFK